MFYFVVILFRSSATSAKWNALVLICQLAAFSNIVNNVSKVKHEYLLLTSVLGVFNLDFFRGVYKPFCLSAHLSTLQVTALDYLIGVYPLFLILVTYVLVKLHNNFRLVVQLWKPFNRCFARLNRQWDIKGSLIGAFATFFLLSYVKMLNVSFNLLTPVSLYTVNGTTVNNTFVYLMDSGVLWTRASTVWHPGCCSSPSVQHPPSASALPLSLLLLSEVSSS